MKRHDFKPRSVNPLTCDTCKEPKADPKHAVPVKMTTISFQVPSDIFADLAARAKNTGDASTSALAKKVVLKAMGYEWAPPVPKRVIPAQPGRYVKKTQ